MGLGRRAGPQRMHGGDFLTGRWARDFGAVFFMAGALVLAASGSEAGDQEKPGDRTAEERSGSSPIDEVQLGQAEQTLTYDIPAGSLANALNLFADESGIQLVYGTEIAEGLRTNGVRGDYTPEQALRLLLAGSGIRYRFADAKTVTLEGAAAQPDGGAIPLDPVRVEGRSENPFGPIDGYVANIGTTGTKTGTPLIETPQSITIITRDRLDAQDADTINEALRYVPGVLGEAFGFDSRVDFLQYRGLDEGGVGVFRDGLALRSRGFAEFRPDLYGAERVEVLRGPASVLYGQGAPGGLLNVVSKQPTREAFGELEVEAGSFDHYEGKFDLGGPIPGTDSLSFRLTGLFRESGTQIDFIDDDRVFIAPALKWESQETQGRTSFTLLGHFQDDSTGATNQFLPASGTLDSNPNGTVPVDRFTGEQDFDEFDRTTFAAGYLFEHQFDETWTIRQNARYDDLKTDYRTAFGVGLDADQRTLNRFAFTAEGDTGLVTVDNQAQVDFATGPAAHTVLLGLDYQYYDVDERQRSGAAPTIDLFDPDYGANVPTPAVFSDANIKQHQIGLYAQEQLKLYENLILTLGGRQDFVFTDLDDNFRGSTEDNKDQEFSWRAGLVYLFDAGIAPYASYSESFLPIPDTDDDSGELFDPETGEQFEVGVKFQPPESNSYVTVSAFHLTRQNVVTSSTPGTQSQTGEVRSRGFEVEALASLPFGLDLLASYTFQDVEITEDDNEDEEGNRPQTVPEHLASLWADYNVQEGPLAGFGLGAGIRYKGSTFGDDRNSFTVDDYILVDAAVRYRWKDFVFAVNAVNLLDNRHVAACQGENACFYGVDQSFTGSVTFRW